MAIMKSEQVMSESTKSFEDAIQTAVSRFSATVRGLKSVYINNQSCTVEGGKIATYRVNMQMTFEIEDAPKKVAAAKSTTAAKTTSKKKG